MPPKVLVRFLCPTSDHHCSHLAPYYQSYHKGTQNDFLRNQTTVDLAFQQKLPLWMQHNNVPAVGIAVIENGAVKDLQVFGELRKGIPAPLNTIFEMASLTKPVVATLTLMLVDEGLWDLDEPLSKYWIDPDLIDDPRHQQLTTRIVLSHQTGFLNWRRYNPTNKLTFEFDPGTKYQYSGEGFEYLRHALELRFEKPLEQIAQSVLLTPLGMQDTHFFWDAMLQDSLFATPHDEQGEPVEEERSFYQRTSEARGSDWLLTTVADYGTFGIYALEKAREVRGVFAEMGRPQVPVSEVNHLSFGLGWLLITALHTGEYVMMHDGSNPGLKTLVLLLPKTNRGVVIFTNGDNGTRLYKPIIRGALDVGDEVAERLNWE